MTSMGVYIVAYYQFISGGLSTGNCAVIMVNKYGEIDRCTIYETDRYDDIHVEIDTDKLKECIEEQVGKNIVSYRLFDNGGIHYKGDILYYGVSLYYKCLETENGVEREVEYYHGLNVKASEVMKNWKD